jgi:predicted PurR-regulated permease PerM
MDFFTFWIIVCIINAIIAYVLNLYILNRGEDVSYLLLFFEVILTLMSFIGLITAIIIAIVVFLMEHGDESVIKSKHHENKNKFNQS